MVAKQFDLAIAGEVNLDLILYGLPLEMPLERELLASGMVTTLGGSSVIVAHNAAMLGLAVQFTTVVGDDAFGRMALERLREAKVDVSGAVMATGQSTGVSVLLPHEGLRHTLTYAGCTAELTVAHLNVDRLKQARHFHLSSLYLQTGLHAGLIELFQELKAAGLSTSIDTNDDPAGTWGQPLDDLLPYVDVLLPNEDELCRMAAQLDVERAAEVMRGKVPVLVIKRGRLGCRVVEGSGTFDVPGVPVQPVDTVGAGDSFDSGFITAYLRGCELRECARAGNVCGALSTQGSGGTEAFRNAALREAFLLEHRFLK